MIYELRTYEAAPGKMPELNARFRDHTLRIFATSSASGRHGQLVGSSGRTATAAGATSSST